MDRLEDIKALYGIASAQTFLLSQLYASLFAADPEARKRMPELLLDIQARMVMSLRAFFGEVESRVQQQETAESAKG